MPARKSSLSFLMLILIAAPVYGETSSVKIYLQMAGAANFFSDAQRDAGRSKSIDGILPMHKTKAFLVYAQAKAGLAGRFPDFTEIAANATEGQFNKLLGSPVGTSGTTSLTSGSAVSSILSLAMEYGAINQSNSGNVATIRTNLFSLAQPLVGGNALPVCTEGSRISSCNGASRWLRKFSASYSVETLGIGTASATGTNAQTGSVNTTNIFGGGYRTAGWSTRMDWFAANPYRVAADKFIEAMKTVQDSPGLASLETSTVAIFAKVSEIYKPWREATVADLEKAKDEADGEQRLGIALDKLIDQIRSADEDFDTKVANSPTAYAAYYGLLDDTIRGLQTNKFSTEFTSQHPLGQANTSNLRLIYSWQPTRTPLLLTFNGAVTWYNSIPADVTVGRVGKLRDAQFSAQVDRKISNLASMQNSVISVAGYYQWQLENALITIDSGNLALGTGIPLPGPAATLLAPKGNIAIAQLKWTLPIKNGTVKIPFSFTWANRTELINESEKRGQVGLTLDLDSVFAKSSR